MLIQSLFYLPTILSLFVVVLIIFRKQALVPAGRTFSALMVLTGVWLLFLYLADISNNADTALTMLRVGHIFSSFIAYTFVLFSMQFPVRSKFAPWQAIILLALPIIFASTTFSSHGISAVDISGPTAASARAGYLEALFFVYNVIYFGGAYIILSRKAKGLSKFKQLQSRLVIRANILAITLNVLFILISYFRPLAILQLLAIPTILIAALVMAYAVLYQYIFDKDATVGRSVIHVTDHLTAKRQGTESLLRLQSAIYATDSQNIALDFRSIENLSVKTAEFIVDLKYRMINEGKHLYFINCSQSVRSSLRNNRIISSNELKNLKTIS